MSDYFRIRQSAAEAMLAMSLRGQSTYFEVHIIPF